jgi:hypothetical protein
VSAPDDKIVTRQILSYFVRNPNAVDSLHGIAPWRLLDEIVHQRVMAAGDALQWLVGEGILKQETRPGLRPVFSLDPDRAEDAERLLEELTAATKRRKEEE